MWEKKGRVGEGAVRRTPSNRTTLVCTAPAPAQTAALPRRLVLVIAYFSTRT